MLNWIGVPKSVHGWATCHAKATSSCCFWERVYSRTRHPRNFLPPYHMRDCWLAEKEGIFFLITRALLVIKRTWLLDAAWLTCNTPAISWFPASNGFWKVFQKRISSEFDLNTVVSSDVLWWKSKRIFSGRPKMSWFAAWKKFEWERLVSHEP